MKKIIFALGITSLLVFSACKSQKNCPAYKDARYLQNTTDKAV